MAGAFEFDFQVDLLEASLSFVSLFVGADGFENDAGGGEHGVSVRRPEDADGDAVVDAGGVVLDVLNGAEIGQGGEIAFGAEFGGLPVRELEAFAVDEDAVAGLAAAVDGGVAGFLVNAWTVVLHGFAS